MQHAYLEGLREEGVLGSPDEDWQPGAEEEPPAQEPPAQDVGGGFTHRTI